MRKLAFYLFIFLILFSSVEYVKAVDDPGPKDLMKRGNNITCLKSAKVNETQDEWKSVEATMRLTGNCNSQSDCEIWRCNSINNEIAEDQELIDICEKNPNSRPICSRPGIIDQLKAKIKKSVEVTAGCERVPDFTPSLSDRRVGPGVINVTTNQKFIPHVDYKFYAIGKAGGEPTSTPAITSSNQDVTGNDNSQQIGEISNFSSIPTPTVPPGSDQNCTGITWDPYGRVFDATSLEPMTNIEVTMIDNKTKKPAIQQFEDNFSITNLSGVFNILVEKEGEYLLDVLTPTTHLFTNSPILNPNYSLIYSDIYYPNKVYVEKQGLATHHDIPLMPKSSPYYQSEIGIIPDSLSQIDMGKFVSYGGRTTFPKTLVCLIGEFSKKQAGDCANADKIGKFSLNIDEIVIPQSERLIIQLKKVDLTSKLFPSVGQVIYPVDNNGKEYGFEPILNYIKGKTSPNTKVVVKSIIDDKLFYETLSDDSGFFEISANNLPIFEYYLELTDSNNKVLKLTTSEFAQKNQMLATNQNIDNIKENNSVPKNIQPSIHSLTLSKFNPTIIIIVLILFLLVTISIGLVLYINKSKSV